MEKEKKIAKAKRTNKEIAGFEKSKKKNRLFNFVFIFILLVVLACLIGFVYVKLTGKIIYSRDYGETGFAPPYNVFEDNKMMFTLNPENFQPSGENIELNVNVSNIGGLVYKKAYYYDSLIKDWQEFNFTEQTIGVSNWIPNSASKQISIPVDELKVGLNAVAAYSCNKIGGEWKCGCIDEEGENCGKWMLQLFNVENNQFIKTVVIDKCMELNKPDTTYILGRDISAEGGCFLINADNVILDGNGKTIKGNNANGVYGIYSEGRINTTVKNFKGITGSQVGIYFSSTNYSSILNNTISNIKQGYGIYVYKSSNNIINRNIIDHSIGANIALNFANENIVSSNDLSYSSNSGIHISKNNNFNNTLVNNKIYGNKATNLNMHSGPNYLVYNNQFGEVKWEKSKLVVKGDLILGDTINIIEGQISIDPSLLDELNSRAELVFYLGPPVKLSIENFGNGTITAP